MELGKTEQKQHLLEYISIFAKKKIKKMKHVYNVNNGTIAKSPSQI